jgi:hypothetical protein
MEIIPILSVVTVLFLLPLILISPPTEVHVV